MNHNKESNNKSNKYIIALIRRMTYGTILIIFGIFSFIQKANAQHVMLNGKIVNIIASFKDGDTTYLGTEKHGIFKSKEKVNNFINCEEINNGFPVDKGVTAIIKSGNNLIAISDKSKLYFSNDFGKTWKENPTKLDNDYLSSLTFFNNKLFLASKQGLLVSSDNGLSWKPSDKFGKRFVSLLVNIDNFLITAIEFEKEGLVYYSSPNGSTWKEIKGIKGGIWKYNVEKRGKYTYASDCLSKYYNGDGCYALSLATLNENATKWEFNTLNPRIIEFDEENNIYAFDVTIKRDDESTFDFYYSRHIYKSTDGGNTWEGVSELNDPFVSKNQTMQKWINFLNATAKTEVDNTIKSYKEEKRVIEERKQRESEYRTSRKHATTPTYGTMPKTYSSDNRDKSNDRFKENNNRGSWMDSKGQMHSR